MSKFINNIQSELTGKRSAIMRPLKATVDPYPVLPGMDDILHEYRIYIRWEKYVSCEPKHLHILMTNVIRELRHDVYGEFRSLMLQLEQAIYKYDMREAAMILRDMNRIMFGG